MTDTQAPTATQTVTIQGVEFTIPARYAEGHVVNANEASTLNQTFAENVRNNAAGRIKAAKTKAEADGVEFSLDAANGEGVSLRQEIQAYADAYEFGARVSRSAEPVDPVQKEAWKIASDVLAGKLAAQGIKRKELEDGVWDETVKTIMAQDKVQKLAAKRVKEREALADDEFDVTTLATKAPAAEAAESSEG